MQTDIEGVKAAVKQAEVEAAENAAKTDPVLAEMDADEIDGHRIHPLSYMRVQVIQRATDALGLDDGDVGTLAVYVLTQNRATIKALGRNPKKLLERAEDWADDIPAYSFVRIFARANAEIERMNAANDIEAATPGKPEQDEGEPEGNADTPTGSPTDSAKD